MRIGLDYKSVERVRRALPRRALVALAAIPVAVILLLSVFGLQASAKRVNGSSVELELPLPEPLADLPALTAQAGEPIESEDGATTVVTVRSGDSLARIFSRVGLGPADVHAVVTSSRDARGLANLRPGRQLTLARDPDGALSRVEYSVTDEELLVVRRDGERFVSEKVERPLERRIKFAEGVITSSLYEAGRQAGLPDGLTMYLANEIFAYDIDFVLDIRQGDRFMVLYEDLYRDGERVRTGAILAAEFVNRGRSHQAVRFVNSDGVAGHYKPDGRAMRRAFRRVPMDVFRISSHFNPNRRHPVLNTIRAHRGVDYAAPTGTPVFAAGDGRVIRRGVHGGYGNTVEIEHPGGITTLYAHLSRFHPNVRMGSRVQQGQVIGYVGMTGLATGPHLHYEFRVNGVHRNPVTVQLPGSPPLPDRYRERFQQTAVPLLAQMHALSNQAPRLASAQEPDDAG